MKQRTITAFFFAVVMLGGLYWNEYSFQLLFSLIAAGMLWEFFGLVFPAGAPHRQTNCIGGLAIGWLPVLAAGLGSGLWWRWFPDAQWQDLSLPLLLFLVFIGLISLTIELFRDSVQPAATAGYWLLGVFYIGLPTVLLFSLAMPGGQYLPNRVLGLLLLIWTNDVVAYLVGSRWGKTKLFERISPKKTWEGTLGGVVCTVLVALGLAQGLTDYSVQQWLALGAVVALLATPGDLVESLLKRRAGVKDSGALMPGHGGLLDRFDSFIFVLPFAWLVVCMLGG